jgi:hypothetical protein
MKAYGGVEVPLHTLTTLTPGKEPLVHIGWEAIPLSYPGSPYIYICAAGTSLISVWIGLKNKSG